MAAKPITAEAPMREFQSIVGKWGTKTFPASTPKTIVTHAIYEICELGRAVGMDFSELNAAADKGVLNACYGPTHPVGEPREEAADVALLLLHLAHKEGFSLWAQMMEKFMEIQGREYGPPDSLGVREHIREEAR